MNNEPPRKKTFPNNANADQMHVLAFLCHTIIYPESICQHFLSTFAIMPFSRFRKATPSILDANDFIRALFLDRNSHEMFVAGLSPDFQNLTLLSTNGIRTSRISEFEWWGAPKLEFKVCSATLMNVYLRHLSTR